MIGDSLYTMVGVISQVGQYVKLVADMWNNVSRKELKFLHDIMRLVHHYPAHCRDDDCEMRRECSKVIPKCRAKG